MARIFIGVAWPYANNAQHFGHLAGVYLPADIFARYHRMNGNEVLMVSGSDMHGTPTTVAAEKEGVAPEVIAERFHKLNSDSLVKMGISYDLFTHTSTPKHTEVVHDVFLTLLQKEHLVLKKMEAAYCPACDRFLPDRYVEGICPHCGKGGARGDQCDSCGKLLDTEELNEPKCKLCGKGAQMRETEHYFLRLTQFEKPLKEFVSNKQFWKDNVYKFTRNLLESGLRDRAVTRDISYGVTIPVEGFDRKRIYVWFEAVCGYLSASRAWAENKGEVTAWERFWKDPDCRHYYFLGKDNIMFHTIIWPSILMGCGGLNLPHNVPANDHLLIGEEKISKSRTKDTSIYLPAYLSTNKPDPLRYYLTIHMPELHDTVFTWDEFIEKNDAELVGTFGNFIHRVLMFTWTNYGEVPVFAEQKATPDDHDMLQQIIEARDAIGESLSLCQFKVALERLMHLAQAGNRYFNTQGPWKLVKTDRERCGTVLNVSLRIVSALAVMSAPFIPFSAPKIWESLGNTGDVHAQKWDSAGTGISPNKKLPKPEVLFSKMGDDSGGKGASGRKADGGQNEKPVSVPPSVMSTSTPVEDPIDILASLDLRIARVSLVEPHPSADKLYKLTADLGNGDIRTMVAGLKKHYTPEELQGKLLVVVANLEPAVLRGVQSQAMLLAAEDEKTVGILTPAGTASPGEKVTITSELANATAKTTTKMQVKFAHFQKLDIRVGIIAGGEGGEKSGSIINACGTFSITPVDRSQIGKTAAMVVKSAGDAFVLCTEKGVLITTERDLKAGSKVK